jgi:hypothetical protein
MGEQRKGKPREPRNSGPPLTGGGPSIVGVSGAMRARDVSRIRAQDATAAEKRLVIKRNPPPTDQPEKTPRTP